MEIIKKIDSLELSLDKIIETRGFIDVLDDVVEQVGSEYDQLSWHMVNQHNADRVECNNALLFYEEDLYERFETLSRFKELCDKYSNALEILLKRQIDLDNLYKNHGLHSENHGA